MKPSLLVLGAACALVPTLALAAPSPFDGTWRTDLASVKLPTRPDVYVLKGGMYDCRSCVPPYSIKADGAFHAIPGHPAVEEVAIKVVDAHTLEQTNRKGGRVVGSYRVTASPDGKTATVAWNDSTNAGAPPVSGVQTAKRVAAAPAGSHATSGSWVSEAPGKMSDEAMLQTLKLENGVLSLSTPTGQSYTARTDGTPAPFKGDPNVTTVTVKQTGPRSLTETDMHDGQVVSVLHVTVSPDGRKLTWSSENRKTHTTTEGVADKV